MTDKARRKIIFYGDSNTYGYDPADFFGNRYPFGSRWTDILQEALKDTWEIEERGQNGRKIPDLKYDKDRIKALLMTLGENDVFSVMLGTNDLLLTMNPDADEAVRKMDLFLAFLTKQIPSSRILILAPPCIGNAAVKDPLYRSYFEESRRMNAGFKRLSAAYGTMFADTSRWDIPLSADLVHFSAEGHRIFAGCICDFLKRTCR